MFENAIACLRADGDGHFWTAPKGEQEAAIRVLEAASLFLPLVIIPDDGEWYQITAKVKRTKDGTRFDNPSVASLPDAPKEEK